MKSLIKMHLNGERKKKFFPSFQLSNPRSLSLPTKLSLFSNPTDFGLLMLGEGIQYTQLRNSISAFSNIRNNFIIAHPSNEDFENETKKNIFPAFFFFSKSVHAQKVRNKEITFGPNSKEGRERPFRN